MEKHIKRFNESFENSSNDTITLTRGELLTFLREWEGNHDWSDESMRIVRFLGLEDIDDDLRDLSPPPIIKNLKKYNEGASSFDIDFAIAKIKGEYSEDSVAARLDEEILEWVDPEWRDEYDSEYEWYIDHNNGEAQDVVIDELINWYQSKYGNISTSEKIQLKERIQTEYECLSY